jgi:hypothetical protein
MRANKCLLALLVVVLFVRVSSAFEPVKSPKEPLRVTAISMAEPAGYYVSLSDPDAILGVLGVMERFLPQLLGLDRPIRTDGLAFTWQLPSPGNKKEIIIPGLKVIYHSSLPIVRAWEVERTKTSVKFEVIVQREAMDQPAWGRIRDFMKAWAKMNLGEYVTETTEYSPVENEGRRFVFTYNVIPQ